MKLHALLFTSIFMAADTGGGGGNAAPDPINTLAKALARIGELEQQAETRSQEVATITQERDTARLEVTTIQGQFNAATTAATTAQADATAARAELAVAVSERATVAANLVSASASVTRLERLLGVHGISLSAVPALGESEGAKVDHRAKYNELLSQGKSKEAGEYYAANRDEFFKK